MPEVAKATLARVGVRESEKDCLLSSSTLNYHLSNMNQTWIKHSLQGMIGIKFCFMKRERGGNDYKLRSLSSWPVGPNLLLT